MSDPCAFKVGMGPRRRAAAVMAVQQELGKAKLRNVYIKERLPRIIEKVAARPDKGLPQIMRDASELEGTYRFYRNKQVDPQALMAAHAEETKGRAAEVKGVVV